MVGVAWLATPTFAFAQAAPPTSIPQNPIARIGPRTLRVMTWNIGANSIAPFARSLDTVHVSRPAAFGRVIRALDPDVICLQEFDRPMQQVLALLDAIRPLGAGKGWHGAQSLGNTVISRFPLLHRGARQLHSLLSQRSHVYATLDVPDSIAPVDPVVVCAHLQSGGGAGNAEFRKRHAESIARDLEERWARDSVVRPVIVLGDMNAVDRTLPDLLAMRAPASAGFPLRSAVALHNGVGRETYTWRDDHQRFEPSVLDYVMFTERAFTSRHAFVLNTMTLDTAALVALSLKRGDTMRDPARGTYDHLPVIADLEWIRPVRSGTPGSGAPNGSR